MYHLAPPDRYTKRARTILGILFAGFVLLDVLVFVSTPPEFRHQLMLQMGLNTMWNAVFFGAMWQRQNWARYVLCFFLLLSVIFGGAVTIPQLLAAKAPFPGMLAVLLAFHVVALLVVAFNPTLRKFLHSR